MKVLLINPWANEIFPPPSLGYIQAALKHWKVDVRYYTYDNKIETLQRWAAMI